MGTIRMATLGERDPIGEKRQKMGLPHQNSEAARLTSTRGGRGNYEGSPSYRGRGRGGYDNNYNSRGSYNANYRGRGSYDNTRGSYRGGYDNTRGSYRGRGAYENSRGSYRGSYNNSYHVKPSMEETQTDRFGNVIRGSYRGATARNNYMKPSHHKPL